MLQWTASLCTMDDQKATGASHKVWLSKLMKMVNECDCMEWYLTDACGMAHIVQFNRRLMNSKDEVGMGCFGIFSLLLFQRTRLIVMTPMHRQCLCLTATVVGSAWQEIFWSWGDCVHGNPFSPFCATLSLYMDLGGGGGCSGVLSLYMDWVCVEECFQCTWIGHMCVSPFLVLNNKICCLFATQRWKCVQCHNSEM